MMFERRDVEFCAESGLKLRGWLFVPEKTSGPRPAVTMADGYAGGHAIVLGATNRRLRRLWRRSPRSAPLLMVVGLSDTVTPTDLALAAYERALEPKKLQLIPGGHFDPYLSQFDKASGAAIAWFRQHLESRRSYNMSEIGTRSLNWDVIVAPAVPVVTDDLPPGFKQRIFSPVSATLNFR